MLQLLDTARAIGCKLFYRDCGIEIGIPGAVSGARMAVLVYPTMSFSL